MNTHDHTAIGEPATTQDRPELQHTQHTPKKPAACTNRRGLLRGALGAAAATVGATALLQTQRSPADAASGSFTASGLGSSAVSATGTNAAYGVNAFSDTEIAVWGRS